MKNWTIGLSALLCAGVLQAEPKPLFDFRNYRPSNVWEPKASREDSYHLAKLIEKLDTKMIATQSCELKQMVKGNFSPGKGSEMLYVITCQSSGWHDTFSFVTLRTKTGFTALSEIPGSHVVKVVDLDKNRESEFFVFGTDTGPKSEFISNTFLLNFQNDALNALAEFEFTQEFACEAGASPEDRNDSAKTITVGKAKPGEWPEFEVTRYERACDMSANWKASETEKILVDK